MKSNLFRYSIFRKCINELHNFNVKIELYEEIFNKHFNKLIDDKTITIQHITDGYGGAPWSLNWRTRR